MQKLLNDNVTLLLNDKICYLVYWQSRGDIGLLCSFSMLIFMCTIIVILIYNRFTVCLLWVWLLHYMCTLYLSGTCYIWSVCSPIQAHKYVCITIHILSTFGYGAVGWTQLKQLQQDTLSWIIQREPAWVHIIIIASCLQHEPARSPVQTVVMIV